MKDYKHYDLIRKPIISEKTTILAEQNKFTFEVAELASKISVKSAIEKIYEVKIKKVNILNVKGKVKRFKGVKGRQSNIKKAIVTLEKSYTIDFGGSK